MMCPYCAAVTCVFAHWAGRGLRVGTGARITADATGVGHALWREQLDDVGCAYRALEGSTQRQIRHRRLLQIELVGVHSLPHCCNPNVVGRPERQLLDPGFCSISGARASMNSS